MPNLQLAPSSLAQWLGAIATSAAVITALFKDEVPRHLRRPKLTIRINPEPPDCLLSPMTFSDNKGAQVWKGNVYWLRLWVENVGSVRAEQVQVFVSKVYKRDATRRFVTISDFVPMNLRWSNSREWRNPEVFAPVISHKMGKHCDLCSISDPANPMDLLEGFQWKAVGTLQLEVYPSGNRHGLPPGDYLLELMVGSANTDPVTTYLELNLTGQWSPDQALMFREHVGVKLVSRPSGKNA
jgi:hypothetical protein